MSALSLQQPNAEQVLRGEKKIEYRNMPTNKRERVYIYGNQ
jgi:predicted transcriptional regulator